MTMTRLPRRVKVVGPNLFSAFSSLSGLLAQATVHGGFQLSWGDQPLLAAATSM